MKCWSLNEMRKCTWVGVYCETTLNVKEVNSKSEYYVEIIEKNIT